MKKLFKRFSGLCASVLLAGAICCPLSASAAFMPGDVNGNGVVDVTDACMAMQIYADSASGGTGNYSAESRQAADVNNDGRVTLEDATIILQWYAQNSASGASSASAEEVCFQMAQEAFDRINQVRQQNGLAACSFRQDVYDCTKIRADEICTNFSHTRPDGTVAFTALKNNGIYYRVVAENIAGGCPDAEAAVNAWMNSEGHRKNILLSNANTLAVAVSQAADGTYYWAMFVLNPL